MEDVDYCIRFSGYISLSLAVCSSHLTSNNVERPPPQHYLLLTATSSLPWWTETRIQNKLPHLLFVLSSIILQQQNLTNTSLHDPCEKQNEPAELEAQKQRGKIKVLPWAKNQCDKLNYPFWGKYFSGTFVWVSNEGPRVQAQGSFQGSD